MPAASRSSGCRPSSTPKPAAGTPPSAPSCRGQAWWRRAAPPTWPGRSIITTGPASWCCWWGCLLLPHAHVLENLRDQLLIEIPHVPLALLGAAGGGARWRELRLAPPASRVAGWVWPGCFVGVGLLLLLYRES